ncbi:TadE family protein [Homoserinibacter sp. GY 40078]|uniref:TadE family protein n=1 Tax=Homoserinibacter sp. GY 40078 TaxID=2603275 RepID=UPI002106C0B3|nr:TadE family protein [Homoserinibacter sp. GY 40078]
MVRSRSAVDDRGSTAAEFAVALPAVILVLGACLGALGVVSQQLRLQDAAADAARGLGRGETESVVAERVQAALAGASIARHEDGELVCVRLSAPAAGPAAIAGLRLVASSCALDGGR